MTALSMFQPIPIEEMQDISGGFIPLLVLGVAALVASCNSQKNNQGGDHNRQINLQYNGTYPDTIIISSGGVRDTIINK
ncbi:MAG TPA: hypothetical protein VIK74_00945 [Parasegetibacter sp.]|jgi:hypothetical protein